MDKIFLAQIIILILIVFILVTAQSRNADVKAAYEIGRANCLMDLMNMSKQSGVNNGTIIIGTEK